MTNFVQWNVCVCLSAVCLVLAIAAADYARADTWRENKQIVEWSFKLGAVSVALEKCPFKKGPRFSELQQNAKDVPLSGEMRSEDEGRKFMLILDGPDLSTLCGTAFQFFGPGGKDLSDVLVFDEASDKN